MCMLSNILSNILMPCTLQAMCIYAFLLSWQGEDVVHDAIRQQQLDAGVPALIAAALTKYKGQNEEVLWAALFSLAVLIREGGDPYLASTDASVEAGLLPLLQAALNDYEVISRMLLTVCYTS